MSAFNKLKQKIQIIRNSPMKSVQFSFLQALLILVIIWLLFTFVFGFQRVTNDDMKPNLKADDLLLYYRLSGKLRVQDVVVLHKNNTTYIGRIVAVSGDSVEISNSEQLIINGNIMLEDTIYTSTPRFEGFVNYPVMLENSQYFILADARSGCEDSRYFGVVQESEITGKVITVLRRNHL